MPFPAGVSGSRADVVTGSKADSSRQGRPQSSRGAKTGRNFGSCRESTRGAVRQTCRNARRALTNLSECRSHVPPGPGHGRRKSHARRHGCVRLRFPGQFPGRDGASAGGRRQHQDEHNRFVTPVENSYKSVCIRELRRSRAVRRSWSRRPGQSTRWRMPRTPGARVADRLAPWSASRAWSRPQAGLSPPNQIC